jgi:hypothetical protein
MVFTLLSTGTTPPGLIVGTGRPGAGLIVNVKALDVPPPAVTTVTVATPGEEIRLASMDALN